MDDQLFDEFTRNIGRTTSKLGIFRLLISGALAAITNAKTIPGSPKAGAITAPINVSISG